MLINGRDKLKVQQAKVGGKKGILLHCWWECKLARPLWRTVWTFHQKLEIELANDPEIPLLGIYPEKILIQKDICYNSQDTEAT